MKNNIFQPPQNNLNNSLNKNPYRIQNYNYMFYLIQENPNLYNYQNYLFQLYQLGLLQNSQQAQLLNLTNGQNVLPFYYNIAYNNLLQLSLMNSNNNLTQNHNLLPNINNINEYQNNFQNNQNNQNTLNTLNSLNIQNNQNNTFLNKKTFNIEHNANGNENEIEDKNENKKIEKNGTDENMSENNNISLQENEIKPEENNSEIKKEVENNKDENNSEEINLEKNEISTTKNEEKKDEDKTEIKTETKKKKKKRAIYKDLLYDPLLEHIGKEEKHDSKNTLELEEEEISSSNAQTKKKEKNKKPPNPNHPRTKPKPRTKNGKHSRKRQHRLTLKNNKDILADLEENKNNEDNSKYTRIIFHGKDYKKTNNINEFMKYNFDFVVDEQYNTKKLITDYDQQHIDVKTLSGNTNIYDNYNYSEQHLDEITNVWSREKFLGNKEELKKAVNIIRDSFNERKIYTNEEKYLNIIKNNNYSIDGFKNKKNN